MTYIYVRKDLTFIEDPASQSLLKAFLTAVYSDEYITQCEEQFGFVRVGGELRQMALDSINALVTDPTAPEWIFETDTIKRIGQGDYVISQKRQSYSEIEQEKIMETIGKLSDKIDAVQAMGVAPIASATSNGVSSTPVQTTTDAGAYLAMGGDGPDTAQIALILSSVSIALWVATIIGIFVKSQTAKATGKEDMMESGMIVN